MNGHFDDLQRLERTVEGFRIGLEWLPYDLQRLECAGDGFRKVWNEHPNDLK